MDRFEIHERNREFPFSFGFTTVARDFKLIEQQGHSILVPWGDEGQNLCKRLRYGPNPPSRRLLRALQRFSVQVPERIYNQHAGRDIELVHDQYAVLLSPELHYSEQTGLTLDEGPQPFLSI